MAKKIIKSYGQLDTFGWGSWSDLKKDYLFLAAENTKNYHGDVFIDYNQMQDYVNKCVKEKQTDFFFIISCHNCGSDFISKDSLYNDPESFERLILRISSHEGKFILATYRNEIFSWDIYDNKVALEWSPLISKQSYDELELTVKSYRK